ncbi:MAG: aminotransferase class I/II-fold pyridoxal phosphate-dependent enzyme, partial [Thermodesulfobacteria bacterium]|nr:aminotransferase class I/II-fold pyridoxal phosphate-dependent enzyme [Thermodesulfobacteriota bacterium]
MQSRLSARVRELKPSATLAVNAKAKSLKAQGYDIVNLSAGEPDFDTPDHIKRAAIKAIEEGFTRYTVVSGIPELREAICERLKEDYGLSYAPEEVVVSCGAK